MEASARSSLDTLQEPSAWVREGSTPAPLPLIPLTQPVPLTGIILVGTSFLVRCPVTPAFACCCGGDGVCPRLSQHGD